MLRAHDLAADNHLVVDFTVHEGIVNATLVVVGIVLQIVVQPEEFAVPDPAPDDPVQSGLERLKLLHVVVEGVAGGPVVEGSLKSLVQGEGVVSDAAKVRDRGLPGLGVRGLRTAEPRRGKGGRWRRKSPFGMREISLTSDTGSVEELLARLRGHWMLLPWPHGFQVVDGGGDSSRLIPVN